MVKHLVQWVVIGLILLLTYEAESQVRVPSAFSNHMVLQRGKVVSVWGWAKPGEQVTLTYAARKYVARANKKGKWRISMKPLKAGLSGSMTIQGKKNRVVIKDVVVGEVWVCSGQSNMQWPTVRSLYGAKVLKKLRNPMIRLLAVPVAFPRKPRDNFRGGWVVAETRTVRFFSAVCFYFGRYLQKKLGVPVGLINASIGGTRAEAWTPREVLQSSPPLRWVFRSQHHWRHQRHHMYSMYLRRYMRWRVARSRAQRAGRPIPRRPRRPPPVWHANSPAASYNGMIAPIVTYGIRGVLWYQGESNIGRHKQYAYLMEKMIGSWRKRWGQGVFPFLFVQIAPYRYRHRPPNLYNRLCEAQVDVWKKVPNTAMVATHDITDLDDIHPKEKREVGRRLYLAALAKAYGQKVEFSGPIFDAVKKKDGKLILSFKYVGKGLKVKGKALKQFVIAGADQKFYPASAKIVGKTVWVWSPKVKAPVAVRLAWREDALHNLLNLAGFPASTFRTDRWKFKVR